MSESPAEAIRSICPGAKIDMTIWPVDETALEPMEKWAAGGSGATHHLEQGHIAGGAIEGRHPIAVRPVGEMDPPRVQDNRSGPVMRSSGPRSQETVDHLRDRRVQEAILGVARLPVPTSVTFESAPWLREGRRPRRPRPTSARITRHLGRPGPRGRGRSPRMYQKSTLHGTSRPGTLGNSRARTSTVTRRADGSGRPEAVWHTPPDHGHRGVPSNGTPTGNFLQEKPLVRARRDAQTEVLEDDKVTHA